MINVLKVYYKGYINIFGKIAINQVLTKNFKLYRIHLHLYKGVKNS